MKILTLDEVKKSYLLVRVIVVFIVAIVSFYTINTQLKLAVYLLLILVNGVLCSKQSQALLYGAVIGYVFHFTIFYLLGRTREGSYLYYAPTKFILPLFGTIGGVIGSALGYVLQQKQAAWLLVKSIVITGLPLWVTAYQQPVMLVKSLLLLSTITAFAKLRIALATVNLFVVLVLAYLIAMIIKIVIDVNADSSNHNLLPFGFAGYIVAAVAFKFRIFVKVDLS